MLGQECTGKSSDPLFLCASAALTHPDLGRTSKWIGVSVPLNFVNYLLKPNEFSLSNAIKVIHIPSNRSYFHKISTGRRISTQQLHNERLSLSICMITHKFKVEESTVTLVSIMILKSISIDIQSNYLFNLK